MDCVGWTAYGRYDALSDLGRVALLRSACGRGRRGLRGVGYVPEAEWVLVTLGTGVERGDTSMREFDWWLSGDNDMIGMEKSELEC